MTPFAQPSGLRFRGKGYNFLASASSESHLDIEVSECCLINGGEFFSSNPDGDTLSIEVLNKEAFGPMPAMTVLDTFLTSWQLDKQAITKIDLRYYARICPGLILRIKYNNTHNTEETIKVNLYLHKTKEQFSVSDILTGV